MWDHQDEKDGNVEEIERRKLETGDVIGGHSGPVCVIMWNDEEYYSDFILPY
jgi:hypothetical protein